MRLLCTSVLVSSALRVSAALGERASSSGPSTLRSRAMLGTMTRPGPNGPGMVCDASCGSQENQFHSARRPSSTTSARCRSSGEWNTAACAAITRAPLVTKLRLPTTLTAPTESRSMSIGMPGVLPKRDLTSSTSLAMNGSLRVRTFSSVFTLIVRAGTVPTPKRMVRKSLSPRRRSHNLSGDRAMLSSSPGSGWMRCASESCRASAERILSRWVSRYSR